MLKLYLVVFSIFLLSFSKYPSTDEDFVQQMVQEQLVSRGIKDKKVLDAMSRIPRHLFVDATLRYKAYGGKRRVRSCFLHFRKE